MRLNRLHNVFNNQSQINIESLITSTVADCGQLLRTYCHYVGTFELNKDGYVGSAVLILLFLFIYFSVCLLSSCHAIVARQSKLVWEIPGIQSKVGWYVRTTKRVPNFIYPIYVHYELWSGGWVVRWEKGDDGFISNSKLG